MECDKNSHVVAFILQFLQPAASDTYTVITHYPLPLSTPLHFLQAPKSSRQVKLHSYTVLAMLVEQGQTRVYCQSSEHK